VFEVCSTFKKEADVVSKEDIVKVETSRDRPSVLRVLP
jgi:hypothetical protein